MEVIKYNGFGNVIYFDNDDDFYNFCVEPSIIYKNDETCPYSYYDFNLTSGYNDALNNCKCFIIKDKNSNIYKNQCVSYKSISKPINNLKCMSYDKILKKKYPEYMICDNYCDECYDNEEL